MTAAVEARMPLLDHHGCDGRHETSHSFAACAIPRAAKITGDGPYGVASYCHGQLVICLRYTERQQLCALLRMHDLGCSLGCQRRHVLFALAFRPPKNVELSRSAARANLATHERQLQ